MTFRFVHRQNMALFRGQSKHIVRRDAATVQARQARRDAQQHLDDAAIQPRRRGEDRHRNAAPNGAQEQKDTKVTDG